MNGLSIGIIKFEIVELQFLVTVDNNVSCPLEISRDNPRVLFDLLMFDIQWEKYLLRLLNLADCAEYWPA